MNRDKFIKILRKELSGIPREDIEDIVYDYEEHFEIGIHKGKTEEEIARELGNPKNIAKSYRASIKITEAEKNPTATNLFKAILAAMALGFFNLVVVLAPFIVIVTLLFSLYAISVGFIIGGVGSFFGTITAPFLPHRVNIGMNPIASISFGIGLAALGVLIMIGCFYLTKLLYHGIIKYLKWNIDIIKR